MKRSSWMSGAGFESGLAAEAKAKSPVKRSGWMSDEGLASGVRAAELSRRVELATPERSLSTGTLAVIGAVAATVILA